MSAAAAKAQRALVLQPTETEVVFVAHIEDDPRRLRRRIDEVAVAGLMSSMAEIGLKTPIVLRHYEERPGDSTSDLLQLVSGGNRLEAARRLGWEMIGAIVLSGADDDRAVRLWEIAENLHRAELTPLERSEHIDEWRKLHAEKAAQNAPVSGKGGRGQKGGTREAARALGIERTEVQRAAKIAALAPQAKEVARDLGLDRKQGALLDAARESSAERQVARLQDKASKPAGAPPAPAPAPAPAPVHDDEIRRISSMKRAADAHVSSLTDDVRRKSGEAVRLSDALEESQKKVLHLTKHHTSSAAQPAALLIADALEKYLPTKVLAQVFDAFQSTSISHITTALAGIVGSIA